LPHELTLTAKRALGAGQRKREDKEKRTPSALLPPKAKQDAPIKAWLFDVATLPYAEAMPYVTGVFELSKSPKTAIATSACKLLQTWLRTEARTGDSRPLCLAVGEAAVRSEHNELIFEAALYGCPASLATLSARAGAETPADERARLAWLQGDLTALSAAIDWAKDKRSLFRTLSDAASRSAGCRESSVIAVALMQVASRLSELEMHAAFELLAQLAGYGAPLEAGVPSFGAQLESKATPSKGTATLVPQLC
jgi:hypothetical protein